MIASTPTFRFKEPRAERGVQNCRRHLGGHAAKHVTNRELFQKEPKRREPFLRSFFEEVLCATEAIYQGQYRGEQLVPGIIGRQTLPSADGDNVLLTLAIVHESNAARIISTSLFSNDDPVASWTSIHCLTKERTFAFADRMIFHAPF